MLELRFWLLGLLLLLLLCLFGPWRHDAVHARIGDGLAEMFAKMSGDHEECSAPRGLAAKHFLRFVEVRIAEGENRSPEMCNLMQL